MHLYYTAFFLFGIIILLGQIRSTISASDLDDAECRKLQEMMHHLESRSVQILVVGATGSGKSITINSLFDLSVAKVGTGTDPETKAITSYTLENLTLWDGPGLGDNVDCDESYTGMLHFTMCRNLPLTSLTNSMVAPYKSCPSSRQIGICRLKMETEKPGS